MHNYFFQFDVLLFYYGRKVSLFDPKKTPTAPGLYLTRKSWLEEHRTANIKEILTDSRPVDKEEAEIKLIQLL